MDVTAMSIFMGKPTEIVRLEEVILTDDPLPGTGWVGMAQEQSKGVLCAKPSGEKLAGNFVWVTQGRALP
jgi:hypothetical protein